MDAVVLTTMKGLKFEVFLRSGRPSRQPDLQVGGEYHAMILLGLHWLQG
jgi:hypothetical protein